MEASTRDVHRQAGEFSLLLVKALLQTGTYSGDHPLAKAATAEMYTSFKDLTSGVTELTYLLLSTMDDQGILVDGLLPEPIPVARMFRGIMGDHFLSKFHDYFVRNRIAAFTIKAAISREQFDQFISALTAWASEAQSTHRSAEDFSEQLLDLGIFDVTVISMDEVVGAKRHLSWPVKIALSRMRKDISKIPLLKGADRAELQRIKIQSMSDIIRPITRYDLHRDILLNADLVADGITITTTPEVEDSLISAMLPEAVNASSELLLTLVNDIETQGNRLNIPGRTVEELRETSTRVLAKGLAKLARIEFKNAFEILEASYRKGYIPLGELPKDLQRRVRSGETTDKFISSADQYLGDFAGCSDPRNYLKYLNVFTIVLPELVNRGDRDMVLRTMAIIVSHYSNDDAPFMGRKRFIEEALSKLETGGFLAGLIRMTCGTPKEVREPLEAGVALFGTAVVPGLINYLTTDTDPTLQTTVSSILVRIGGPAVNPLIDELRAHRHGWQAIRPIIRVLGHLKARSAEIAIAQYSAHPHPKVREESLAALTEILGSDAEKYLLAFIRDEERQVARRAILQLAALHCTHTEFLTFLNESIRLRTRKEDEPEDAVQAVCLRALAEYERVLMPREPDIEASLIEILVEKRFKAFLPGRLGRRQKSTQLKVLAVQALAVRGGARTLQVMKDLMNSSDEEVARTAKEAFDAMETRRTQVLQPEGM